MKVPCLRAQEALLASMQRRVMKEVRATPMLAHDCSMLMSHVIACLDICACHSPAGVCEFRKRGLCVPPPPASGSSGSPAAPASSASGSTGGTEIPQSHLEAVSCGMTHCSIRNPELNALCCYSVATRAALHMILIACLVIVIVLVHICASDYVVISFVIFARSNVHSQGLAMPTKGGFYVKQFFVDDKGAARKQLGCDGR